MAHELRTKGIKARNEQGRETHTAAEKANKFHSTRPRGSARGKNHK